ncbi:MAG: hypothetical protein ACXWP4_24675, partial [Polyangiales bacterium]
PKELLAEAEGRTKRTIDIDAVWRAFREDPTDERRMVLADALQTLGDPRGEYIALSMAIAEGRADPAITKRAAQLLDANIDAWTGPLPGAERSSRRFERGFLAEVHLKTKGKKLLESVSAPEWATIEELHLEAADILEYHRDALVKLFESAPSLRAFIAHSFGSEELLASLVGPFPRIRAFGARDFLPSAKVPAFPNLALVGTSTFWFGVDHALECASRVGAEVLLLFGVDDLAAAVEQLHQSKVPEARFLAGNRHVAPGRHEGWCVRVRRGDPRAELVWGTGRYTKDSLTQLLEMLAKRGAKEVVVTLPRLGKDDASNEAASFEGATVRTDGRPIDLWKL